MRISNYELAIEYIDSSPSMSIRDLAAKYDVSKSTIHNRLHKACRTYPELSSFITIRFRDNKLLVARGGETTRGLYKRPRRTFKEFKQKYVGVYRDANGKILSTFHDEYFVANWSYNSLDDTYTVNLE